MNHHTHIVSDGQTVHDDHCDRCGNDLTSAAYILAGGFVLAALIIAGTVAFNFNKLYQIGNQFVQIQKDALSQNAPSAPSGAAAQPSAPVPPPGVPVNIKLAPSTPYLGSGSAKVTVVEYADYQCPFCERWYTGTWPEIIAKYVDTGKIKFVFQDFAFLGADSNTLAEGSHCAADQNKFWQYHDYIFSHQGQENTGWATPDKVKPMAVSAGLNAAQFNSCLDSGKYKKEVQDETAAGRSYGVSGTPSTFVNGQIIVGAQPAATFIAAIDAALKK